MRTAKFIFLILVFNFSCKKEASTILTSTSIKPSKVAYELIKISNWGSPILFNSGDKTLSFDSLAKKVTISGFTSKFQTNGVYPYRFYDTIINRFDPRTQKDIPQIWHLLYIKNFPAQRLSVIERNSKTLTLNADYIVAISDDEESFYFSSK